jgi:hypothetical protein
MAISVNTTNVSGTQIYRFGFESRSCGKHLPGCFARLVQMLLWLWRKPATKPHVCFDCPAYSSGKQVKAQTNRPIVGHLGVLCFSSLQEEVSYTFTPTIHFGTQKATVLSSVSPVVLRRSTEQKNGMWTRSDDKTWPLHLLALANDRRRISDGRETSVCFLVCVDVGLRNVRFIFNISSDGRWY